MLFAEGASRDGDRKNSARRRRMLKWVRLFCHTHGLPIALVVLAAVGTSIQILVMPAIRARVYEKKPSLADIQSAAVEDTSMLEIEQITLSDCKLTNMKKMRIRVFDLDGMLAASAQRERKMAARKADSLAGMMMQYQPVDTRSLHETERSNLKKILR